jgi:hypothetical protein
VEYARESSGARYEVLASDSVCWGCHVGAEATDWRFVQR